MEDSFDIENPNQDQKYCLSPLLCQMSPYTLSVKQCLRSTKLLTKRYPVTFFDDPHVDSILDPVPKIVDSLSFVAKC